MLLNNMIIGVQVVNPHEGSLFDKIQWVVLKKGMTYDQVHR